MFNGKGLKIKYKFPEFSIYSFVKLNNGLCFDTRERALSNDCYGNEIITP